MNRKLLAPILAALLPLWMLGSALPVRAGGLKAWVRKTAAEAPVKHAHWGLCVRRADTGKLILEHDSHKNLMPASALKLLVTGAALETLGPEHRFKTALYHDGRITDGRLQGNIYIKGGGDPTLGSTLVQGGRSMEEVLDDWVQALKDKGIKTVQGDVVADNLLFEGPPVPGDWPWEDLGNYYGAKADALSIHDNLFHLVFAPADQAGERAPLLRTEPEVPGLEFVDLMMTGPRDSGDDGWVYNMPGNFRAVLRGTVPAGHKEFSIKGALPEPALFAAQALRKRLEEGGLRVIGRALLLADPMDYDESKKLAETRSVPLREIVRRTNKRSFNLYAEMLGRAVALARGEKASLDGGARAVKSFVGSLGVDVSRLRLKDSCGLSRRNNVSAELMTGYLVAMTKTDSFPDYLGSLVVPGDPEGYGHIKHFGEGTILEKSLRIKSGSLNGVRAYSGYVSSKSGSLLAFTFIINEYTASPADIERIHQDLMLRIAESR